MKLVYETDHERALDWLPPSLCRTSPAYAIVMAAHYPESPIGPFRLAAQYIGCRAQVFIRAFTLHAVTDSVRALAALREVWGFPACLGRVRLTAGKRSLRAQVETDGQVIADLRLDRMEACDVSLVRFDPVLNVRLMHDLHQRKRHSLLEMVQIDPQYRTTEASRGRPTISYSSANEGAPWHLLAPLNPISGAHCVCDTELSTARFVMPY